MTFRDSSPGFRTLVETSYAIFLLLVFLEPDAIAQSPNSFSRAGELASSRMLSVDHLSIVSPLTYDEVVRRLRSSIGHPDMAEFRAQLAEARTEADLERAVHAAVDPSGFMEFYEFNAGQVLEKQFGSKAPKSMRFLIGNPLIMKQMTEFAPDAASYAPVTVLVDERSDGVHLSYDTVASFLLPDGSDEASKVARDLDTKLEKLLAAVARSG
jgi:uncharacterized protein (DUF302 family)